MLEWISSAFVHLTPRHPPQVEAYPKMSDEEILLNELSSTMSSLLEDPHSMALHKTHISLNERTGMDLDGARRLCAQYLAAPEDVWSGILKRSLENVEESSMESVLEDFVTAEGDYLSIPMLKMHAEFLVGLSASSALSDEEVGERLHSVMDISEMDMERGQVVWDVIRDWEVERIERTNPCVISYRLPPFANSLH